MWLRARRVLLQYNSDDCGPSVLATVGRYYRAHISVERLRHLMNVRNGRTTILDLVDTAQAVGFEAKGFKADWEGLSKLSLPAIAHWEQSHFVVIWEIDKRGNVLIGDPATGDRWLSKADFEQAWQGIVVTLKPTDLASEGSTGSSYGMAFNYLRSQMIDWHTPAAILLISSMMALLGLVFPGVVRWVIDDLSGQASSPISISVLLYMLLFIVLIQGGAHIIREYFVGLLIIRLNLKMSIAYLTKLLKTKTTEIESRRLGDLLTRFGDIGQIQTTFIKFLVETSFGLFLLLGTAAFVATKTVPFLWFLFLPIPVVFFLVRFIHPEVRSNERLVLHRLGGLQSYLVSVLSSLKLVQVFRAERLVSSMAEQHLHTVMETQLKGQIIRAAAATLSSLVPGFGQVALLLIGAEYVRQGTITLGDLVAASTLLALYFSAWNAALDMAARLQETLSASYRLHEIYSLPELDTAGLPAPLPLNGISAEGLQFNRGSHAILSDVSVHFRSGAIAVLTGPPGSGKSTLLHLLAGVYQPTEGTLCWNGIPYKSLKAASLYDRVAFMSQEPQLLSGTLLDNLLLGAEVNQDKIAEALHRVDALGWVQRLPHGIYTLIGNEAAYRLSAGQQQILSWARVILRNAPVLLFDEPTSSVDTDGVRQFAGLIQQLRDQGRVICVATHDPVLISIADDVTSLQNGRIQEIRRKSSTKKLLKTRG